MVQMVRILMYFSFLMFYLSHNEYGGQANESDRKWKWKNEEKKERENQFENEYMKVKYLWWINWVFILGKYWLCQFFFIS